MNEEISNGLERALRGAANSAGGNSGNNGGGMPSDPVSVFMQVLPTLVEKWEERGALGEEQKEGIDDLLKQTVFVRKQLAALVQSHKAVLEELRLMREVQSAIIGHLARVQIIDLEDGPEGEVAFDDPLDGPEDYPPPARPDRNLSARARTAPDPQVRGPRKTSSRRP